MNVSSFLTKLHPLGYPLTLDLETLALVFLGQISSWVDPRMTARNLNLTAAFVKTQSDPIITLVLCGKGIESGPGTLGVTNHLMLALSATEAFQGYQLNLPVDWSFVTAQILSDGGPRFILVDAENQMEDTVLSNPGSIGYVLGFQPQSDLTKQFQMVREYSDGGGQLRESIVQSSKESLLALATGTPPTSDFAFLTNAARSTASAFKDAWPIPLLYSLGMATSLSSLMTDEAGFTEFDASHSTNTSLENAVATAEGVCFRQTHAVQLVQWVSNSPRVEIIANSSGHASFASLENWRMFVQPSLDEVACDNVPIVYQPPIVWSMSYSVRTFGRWFSAAGVVLVMLSTFMVIMFRRRSIIYSASIYLQLQELFGFFLLCVSVILFSIDPSKFVCNVLGQSCSGYFETVLEFAFSLSLRSFLLIQASPR